MGSADLIDNATPNATTVDKDSIGAIMQACLNNLRGKLGRREAAEAEPGNRSSIAALADADDRVVGAVTGDVDAEDQGIVREGEGFAEAGGSDVGGGDELHLARAGEDPADVDADEVGVLAL